MANQNARPGPWAVGPDGRCRPTTAAEAARPRGAPDALVPIETHSPQPQPAAPQLRSEALEELAASIRAKGVIQPLIVRPRRADGGYEIVAGERRWRAAQMAQLHEVPVLVRDFDDTEMSSKSRSSRTSSAPT